MSQYFGILGGMGTLATTNFLVEMNQRFHPESDQAYFNYVLFNHATVPDRTAFILDSTQPSPVAPLIDDLKRLEQLSVDFVVIPCNTAHYFFDQLQASTNLKLINMLDLVGEEVAKLPNQSLIGLCATKGTRQSGIYQSVVESNGGQLVLPNDELQDKITSLIYDNVKAKGRINLDLYEEILNDFLALGVSKILLGCTEVSYVNSHDPIKRFPIIDSEKLLVDETIRLGKITQNK
ncbi:aspartate/glutamate racemase family protein [Atopobacter phocae]|uniref:aspartate/glutamate racemase family protein n=1 Tax=Atopobacter phocae TaxID=136492 RepID=UPI0004712F3E|nr:amino acid racemase [Atopobacter phocae]